MENKELRNFVSSVIAEKKLAGVEQDVLDQLINELTEQLQSQINRALVESLDEHQLEQFERLVDEENTDKLQSFFQENHVPVQSIVTHAMARFRVAYLGT